MHVQNMSLIDKISVSKKLQELGQLEIKILKLSYPWTTVVHSYVCICYLLKNVSKLLIFWEG